MPKIKPAPADADVINVEELKTQYINTQINPYLTDNIKLVKPPCSHFSKCGGCQLQHIPVEHQPFVKKRMLEAIFNQATIDPSIIEDTRSLTEHAFNYRNKADFTSKTFDDQIHLGFTPYGGRGQLIEADQCPILMPVINETLTAVRKTITNVKELARKLVSVTIRASQVNNESFILYHSKYKEENIYGEITKATQKQTDKLKGGTFIKKRREHTIGSSVITEDIGSLKLSYTVRTFFQANIYMLENLCNAVEELITPCKQKEVLLDIYCGVGLFALKFGSLFSEVYGIESTPASIKMAIKNGIDNGMPSIPFYRDTAEERLAQLLRTGIYPDVIILDPPRSGLHKNVIASLAGLKPSPDLILVSCNPHSLVLNIKDLQKAGYILERIIPIDMFPQTEHLEVVAKMTRNVS